MLSLCMIVKNEGNYLYDCLKSVKEVVDEIIIIDTGSTDKTIEIAKKFNAKIFTYKWNDDFSAARNYSLEHCNYDWVLYLDADERLSEKSINEIKEIVKSENNKAYFCKVININKLTQRPALMDYVRLFSNKKSIKFVGKIHEQIEPSLIKNNIEIKKSDIEIIHLGYNVSEDKLLDKAKRNLTLLLSEYEKEKTSYYAYQLGQTYGILKDKDNAVKYFLISLKDTTLKKEYSSIACRYIAIHYSENNNWEKAFDYINKSIEFDKNQPIALLVAAKIYSYLGKNVEVAEFCKKSYQVNSDFLKGKNKSFQTILLDNKTIIEESLLLAAKTDDYNLFNYFVEKLKNENLLNDNNVSNLLVNIFNNQNMSEEKISECLKEFKKENLISVLNILDKYQHIKSKIVLLEELYKLFPTHILLIEDLALEFRIDNQFLNSEKMYEKSYNLNKKNASILFYLISLYIQNKRFDKISLIINEAENNFKNNEFIYSKIKLLKDKLSEYLHN